MEAQRCLQETACIRKGLMPAVWTIAALLFVSTTVHLYNRMQPAP